MRVCNATAHEGVHPIADLIVDRLQDLSFSEVLIEEQPMGIIVHATMLLQSFEYSWATRMCKFQLIGRFVESLVRVEQEQGSIITVP